MMRDFFFGGSREFSIEEMDVAAELMTGEELHVPLPDDNLDFHQIAVKLAKSLPHRQEATRDKLRTVTKTPRYRVEARSAGESSLDGLEVTYWRLQVGGAWTVPAVEIEPADANGTVLLISDGGRQGVGGEARQALRQGRRVIGLDPFYFGESHIEPKDWLWSLLIAALGERPLGIQAGQIAAAARWVRSRHGEPVRIHAIGPRTSLAALIAGALEAEAVSGLRLEESLGRVGEIIDRDLDARQAPELFCFGLLEAFEIDDIEALVAPRPIESVPLGR